MSKTFGRTQAPPENGCAQMPTLIPPVSVNARRFWSWYCHRSPMEGFQIPAFAVAAVAPFADAVVPLRDGVEEHETRNASNTTIQSRRRSGMVSSWRSDGWSLPEAPRRGQFRGPERPALRGHAGSWRPALVVLHHLESVLDALVGAHRSDVADRAVEVVGGEGLRQIAVRAGLEAAELIRGGRQRREEDHRDLLGRLVRPEVPEQGEAVLPRHHDVEDDHVRTLPEGGREAFLAVPGRDHLVPEARQGNAAHEADIWVVVDNECSHLTSVGSKRQARHRPK